MTRWMLLPCTLLAGVLAAQTNSVPAGTAMMVRLDTTLATFSNKDISNPRTFFEKYMFANFIPNTAVVTAPGIARHARKARVSPASE